MTKQDTRRRFVEIGCMMLVGLFVAAAPGAAQDTTHDGLEVTVSHLERADIVPLGDCPPGENIVRGVIRAGDEANEFVTVHLDFKVLPGFQGVDWPRPSIHDANGRLYRTAQVFADMDRLPEYSCNFSFRVPDGMKVQDFMLDEGVALDLTAHDR